MSLRGRRGVNYSKLAEMRNKGSNASTSSGLTVPLGNDTPTQPLKRNFLRQVENDLRKSREEMPIGEIVTIDFSIMSEEQMRAIASFKCNIHASTGQGSVRDPRFGPINGCDVCPTCGQGFKDCIGHYGLIEIPDTIHPDAGRFILLLLECICHNCGNSLVTKEKLEAEGISTKKGTKRIKAISELIKREGITCQNREKPPGVAVSCKEMNNGEGVPQIEFNKYEPSNYLVNAKNNIDSLKNPKKRGKKDTIKESFPHRPEDIYNKLKSIPEDQLIDIFQFLPGSHPKDLIIRTLLAPPLAIRPDIASRTCHFISEKLSSIIRLSEQYRNSLVTSTTNATNAVTLRNKIQAEITSLVKGDKMNKNVSSKSSSIKELLSGKKGMIRSHGGTGTSNFSARAVAASGYDLPVDTIGIPRYIANKIFIQETVTVYNSEWLQSLCDERKVYAVTESNGSTIMKPASKFFAEKPDYIATPGDIIYRYLQDGDIVVLNRQPTFHRFSMLAFYAKIEDLDVVRAPLEVTGGYNLDFDGDEANLHFPVLSEARVEAELLLSVRNNVLDDKTGAPIIVMIQDNVLTAYLLTRNLQLDMKLFEQTVEITQVERYYEELITSGDNIKDIIEKRSKAINDIKERYADEIELARIDGDMELMDKDIFNQVLDDLSPYFTKEYYEEKKKLIDDEGLVWGSRRSLFSIILPPDFYFDNKKVENRILVTNGILIKGVITSEDVGRVALNMVSTMIKLLGPDIYLDFLFHFRIMTNTYLRMTGFSIGFFDAFPDNYEDLKRRLEEKYRSAVLEVENITSGSIGTRMEKEEQEKRIMNILSLTKHFADTGVRSTYSPNNPYNETVNSGSKGGVTNIAQIIAHVGQQNVSGERMKNIPGANRPSPFYLPGTNTPETGGFVNSSFLNGLNGMESFAHASKVRQDLTRTASNIPDLGYFMRKVIKLNENLRVNNDGSITIGNKKYVSPIFGDTGYSTSGVSYDPKAGGFIPVDFQNIADMISAKYD